jgi:nucleoid-associated protein YgaU
MDLDFLKEMGESLKGTNIDTVDEFEKALVNKVKNLRLSVSDLDIQYDKGVATVMGMVPDQATKEKVILAVGNTKGVAKVKDNLAVGLTASQKTELRKRAKARAGARSSVATALAAKAAEKARKEAKAKFELEMRRAAFKKELGARAKDSGASATYTVKKGDSLSKISKKLYGDASKWRGIYEANQPLIKNPDLIYPGQVLRIPKLYPKVDPKVDPKMKPKFKSKTK